MTATATQGRSTILPTLAALGLFHALIMGSTFSSLGVVLPFMLGDLGLDWTQAGAGFTWLALAAGFGSAAPAWTVSRLGARRTLLLGCLAMGVAYLGMNLARDGADYQVAAALLGLGFALMGAVPALHILASAKTDRPSLVFGAYLACGGLGGGLWPIIVDQTIAALGGWRPYWLAMIALLAVLTILGVILIPGDADTAETAETAALNDWTLGEALRTRAFYLAGLGIAVTYLIASTVNAFAFSYLTLVGIEKTAALTAFGIQSAGHAAFPLILGEWGKRVPVERLLAVGLILQAAGMIALANASGPVSLALFALGVGGGYGTVFLGTTLAVRAYFGTRHYGAIFGANQLFTTVSVVGPVIIGLIADRTGRFDASFTGCALLLALTAGGILFMRAPARLALASGT